MLYYQNTMQHKAIKLMAAKLAVASIIEGGFSEEGLAAMYQCDDMTSQMAKELMLGIKDSVEDVSSAFKRMAFLKPKDSNVSQNTVVFADTPVEIMQAANTKPSTVEFTFSTPVTPKKDSSAIVQTEFRIPAVKKPKRGSELAENENQLSFFEKIA